MTHVDLVKNDWGLEQQQRVARVAVEQFPGSSSNFGEAALQTITNKFTNAYFFATDQHEDEDCPFRESNIVPMLSRAVPEGEEYVLSRIS